MPSADNDLSSLLNQAGNAAFAEACYKLLLQRPASLYETRNALELLTGGMPRKAFIYWMLQSKEFGDRMSVENMDEYRSCYFRHLSRQPQPLVHRLLLTRSGKFQLEALSHIQKPSEEKVEYPELLRDFTAPRATSTLEEEYDALALGQIDQIPHIIKSAINNKKCTTAGHLASELLPADTWSAELPFNDLNQLSMSKLADPVFITNPAMIYNLLLSNELPTFAKAIQEALILTMPILPIPHEEVGFIWDHNWDHTELEPNGQNCRWFHGDANTGNLILFNNSDYYKKISLDFTLTSLEENAEVFIEFNKKVQRFSFRRTRLHTAITLYLKPWYNCLSFTYVGKGIIPAFQATRIVKFSVNSLTAAELTLPSHTYTQQQTYHLDNENLGTSYSPYCLSDSFLRSVLHKSGFFQIDAFRVSHVSEVTAISASRYHYSKELMNRNCYYMTSSEQPPDELTAGINVYIARRLCL